MKKLITFVVITLGVMFSVNYAFADVRQCELRFTDFEEWFSDPITLPEVMLIEEDRLLLNVHLGDNTLRLSLKPNEEFYGDHPYVDQVFKHWHGQVNELQDISFIDFGDDRGQELSLLRIEDYSYRSPQYAIYGYFCR